MQQALSRRKCINWRLFFSLLHICLSTFILNQSTYRVYTAVKDLSSLFWGFLKEIWDIFVTHFLLYTILWYVQLMYYRGMPSSFLKEHRKLCNPYCSLLIYIENEVQVRRRCSACPTSLRLIFRGVEIFCRSAADFNHIDSMFILGFNLFGYNWDYLGYYGCFFPQVLLEDFFYLQSSLFLV